MVSGDRMETFESIDVAKMMPSVVMLVMSVLEMMMSAVAKTMILVSTKITPQLSSQLTT